MITLVGNLKGGSGKSTVTFNIAVWLAVHGRPVTVFDLDPQRTLTDVAEVRSEEGFKPHFAVEHGGPDLHDRLDAVDGEVLVDVGTADMAAMHEALAAADRIIVPVPPSQADIWGTQRFLGMVAEHSTKDPEVLVFVNRADTHHSVRESDETEAALAAMPGTRLIPRRLHQRTAYRRSFSEGMGVFELEPSGKAATEFMAFAGELFLQPGKRSKPSKAKAKT